MVPEFRGHVSKSGQSAEHRRSYGIGPNHRVHFYNHGHEARYHGYEKIHQYQPITRDYSPRGYRSYHEYKQIYEYDDPWEYSDYIDYRPRLQKHRRKANGRFIKVQSKLV